MSLQLILANAARIPKYRFYFGERGISEKKNKNYPQGSRKHELAYTIFESGTQLYCQNQSRQEKC